MVRAIPAQYDFRCPTRRESALCRETYQRRRHRRTARRRPVRAGRFAASPKLASKAVPRVVFIVGPAGAATDGYRAQARAAAAIARKYTPDVVELYSPDATWPAVKQALAGASLVVYMGHGNGWPSRYRDSLYPADPGRLRAQPQDGRRRLHPPVLRRSGRSRRRSSSRRTPSSCSTTCATRAATPSRASPRGRSTRPPAGRQLRRRLHQGRRLGGHRRGVVEPVVLREGRPRWRPVDPERLAERPEREPPPIRVRQRAQPRLHRADGPRDGHLRLHALDRDEGRAGAEGRPRGRVRVGRSRPPSPVASRRPDPARGPA